MRGPPPAEHEGIVVGRHDYGETDRILRVLTPGQGRVGLVARGARAPRSRHAALDLACRIRFAAPDKAGLRTLASAEVLDGRIRMRTSLGRLAVAAYACELCGALAREDHPEPRLFGLLEMTLLLLDATDADPGAAFLVGLEAKALTFAGVGPALDRCAGCGGAIEAPILWVPGGGGVRHARCATTEEGKGTPITEAWARAVEAARRAPLRDLLDGELPAGPPEALAQAIAAHVGRALPSRRVLDALLH